jgi:hypothetical protein
VLELELLVLPLLLLDVLLELLDVRELLVRDVRELLVREVRELLVRDVRELLVPDVRELLVPDVPELDEPLDELATAAGAELSDVARATVAVRKTPTSSADATTARRRTRSAMCCLMISPPLVLLPNRLLYEALRRSVWFARPGLNG